MKEYIELVRSEYDRGYVKGSYGSGGYSECDWKDRIGALNRMAEDGWRVVGMTEISYLLERDK